MSDLDTLRYPVGRFVRPSAPLDARQRAEWIEEIAQAPSVFRSLVAPLRDEQLDRPYRRGGWTIRQVVHHVPESHMNAYIRMKLAATEDNPRIKTYEEQRWAELPDARSAPVSLSLDLLDALHRRWVLYLRSLADADFKRSFTHPELGSVEVDHALALYAWHGRHHAAHIRLAIDRPSSVIDRPASIVGRPASGNE
jgi:hypothetical protein